MPKLTRKTLIQVKTESVYGTAPSFAVTDAILCAELDVNHDINLLELNNYKGSLSPDGSRVGRKLWTMSFQVDLCGNGALPTLATPLEMDPLLRACGLTVAYDATGCTYTPHSDDDNMHSVAIKANLDGQVYLLEGGYGNVQFNLEAGAYGKVQFDFTGLYNEPTDEAQVSPSFKRGTTKPPICENAGIDLDGYAVIAQMMEFNMNNEIGERPDLNSAEGIKGLRITGRRPTGTINPEMMAISDKNFFSILDASSEIGMDATIGSTSGNIFVFNFPTLQLEGSKPSDRDGIRSLDMNFVARGDDNEFNLRCK